MKEFDFDYEGIFSGLYASIVLDKQNPSLEACHNLEPDGDDYQLHERVLDLHTDSALWGIDDNKTLINIFRDNLTDAWEDHDNDDWTDS